MRHTPLRRRPSGRRGHSSPTPLRAPIVVGLVLLAALAAPSPATAQASGSIEGRIDFELPTPRKWANRYPGGSAKVGTIQALQPVVTLRDAPIGPVLAGDTVDIDQRDERFVPSTLAVRAGTTVRFPNSDPFYHNVFSFSSNARFDLGRYPEGVSRSVTLTEPGLVQVYCEVHEYMRAVILVTEHGYQAVADEDGSFRIDGVPAGTYTLVVEHPDLGVAEQEIVVMAGAVIQVDVTLGAGR